MANEETRWLDSDETEAWIPLASMLLTLPAALDAQLQRDSALTFYEYVVLASLSNADAAGYRMSDLATVTSGALSRLSQVVTRMEKRSWVARVPDPDDGRATRVVLRPAGRKQLEAAAPGHVATVRRLVFDPLNETQVQQLRRIAMRVASAVAGPDNLLHSRSTRPVDQAASHPRRRS